MPKKGDNTVAQVNAFVSGDVALFRMKQSHADPSSDSSQAQLYDMPYKHGNESCMMQQNKITSY